MKRSLSILATLALAATAQANTKTEYFYQTKGGAWDLTVDYSMGSSSGWDNNKRESGIMGLEAAYGYTDSMQFSVATTTGEDKTTTGATEEKDKGMGDLEFGFQMNDGMLYYGLDLTYSGKKKDEKRTTGGISLIPMVGIMMSAGELNYGAKLMYAYNMEKKEEALGGDNTLTGANGLTVAAFAEMGMGAGHLWGELAMASASDLETKAPNGTKTTTKSPKSTAVTVGYAYHFNEMVTGLASYSYAMVSDAPGTDTKYNLMTWTLGARIGF
ncbi:MAG: hypothetical protein ACK5P6_06195 [Pseudobdellovibrionaceae bacterium]